MGCRRNICKCWKVPRPFQTQIARGPLKMNDCLVLADRPIINTVGLEFDPLMGSHSRPFLHAARAQFSRGQAL